MKEKNYRLFLGTIIFLALFLRFFNFPSRWQIYSDQARDALVARGALKNKSLPLIGSFSSAGPFVFGPLFYWFVITGYWLGRSWLVSPWVLITLVDVLLVFIISKIGCQLGNKKMALLTAFLAAISPNQILRASNLTQHTLVNICTTLTILFFILVYQKKRLKDLFFLGLSIALAISMHYQALNLVFYLSAVFFFFKQKKKNIILAFLSLALGLLLPSLPLLYWDFGQKWANIKNILDYFLIGQYRVWVSNRWLTYLTDFWPRFWAGVSGGQSIIGFSFMLLVCFLGAFLLFKKKLKKELLFLGMILLVQIVLNRYYRGERFLGYLLYFHPLLLVLSSWAIFNLIKLKKAAGLLFLLIVVVFTLKKDIQLIKNQDNHLDKVYQTIAFLKDEYPNKKFSIYDFYYQEPALSQILSLFLDDQGLIDERDGVLLGVSPGPVKDLSPISRVSLSKDFYLYQLDDQLISQKKRWINVNPGYVYQDILFWWKKRPLQSSFSLKDYLKEKSGL